MIQTSVESSNVAQLGWEDDHLYVRFKRGHVYRYTSVPMQVYNEAVDADSVGKYLVANVFKNYPYAQVEGTVQGFTTT